MLYTKTEIIDTRSGRVLHTDATPQPTQHTQIHALYMVLARAYGTLDRSLFYEKKRTGWVFRKQGRDPMTGLPVILEARIAVYTEHDGVLTPLGSRGEHTERTGELS